MTNNFVPVSSLSVARVGFPELLAKMRCSTGLCVIFIRLSKKYGSSDLITVWDSPMTYVSVSGPRRCGMSKHDVRVLCGQHRTLDPPVPTTLTRRAFAQARRKQGPGRTFLGPGYTGPLAAGSPGRAGTGPHWWSHLPPAQ